MFDFAHILKDQKFDCFASYLKDVNKIGPRNISSKEILLPVFPRGSVLGPLLFLIYLNGISSTCNQLIFYLFVHDRSL